jgi:hypothetical protein
MAVIDSPLSSYSDTTVHKRAITDVIDLIDPSDAPVVESLGGLDGAASKFRFTAKSTKIEWIEDTLPPLAGALDGSVTSALSTLTVADSSVYQDGMIILIDAEYMWVVDDAASATTFTVTRGYGGTQASHADAAVVTIVSMARLEGADSDDLAFTDKTAPYNYTSIFQHEVKVTGTMQELEQYGLNDEMSYQVAKSIPHLMRLLNASAYHSQRKQGSASTPRGFGGFATFITDNTVDYSTAITQANIDDALELAYADGGVGPWNIYLSPANMQVVKNIYDSSSYVRFGTEQSQIGLTIDSILTPFGMANFILDRQAPNAQVWIVDPSRAGFTTYRPFFWDPLAKTGDADKVEVVGEFSFAVSQDKAHAELTT